MKRSTSFLLVLVLASGCLAREDIRDEPNPFGSQEDIQEMVVHRLNLVREIGAERANREALEAAITLAYMLNFWEFAGIKGELGEQAVTTTLIADALPWELNEADLDVLLAMSTEETFETASRAKDWLYNRLVSTTGGYVADTFFLALAGVEAQTGNYSLLNGDVRAASAAGAQMIVDRALVVLASWASYGYPDECVNRLDQIVASWEIYKEGGAPLEPVVDRLNSWIDDSIGYVVTHPGGRGNADFFPMGDPEHYFVLGVSYLNGYGVPQDAAEALRWLSLAGDQGHVAAAYNLGVMYLNGTGVVEDVVEAARWVRRARDQGHEVSEDLVTRLQAEGELLTDGTVTIGGQMWTREDNGKSIDFESARAYCERMALAGYSDWRLPTIDELATLFDPAVTYMLEETPIEVHPKAPIRLASVGIWSSSLAEQPGEAFMYVFDQSGGRGANRFRNSAFIGALCSRTP